MNLENQIAIITGGASGIGEAITKKLASLGATVIINYNSSGDKAHALVKTLQEQNLQADCLQANVADFNEAKKLVDFAITKYGKIDILVNNAGINADNLIIRMSEDDFDKVIDVNLKGTWNLCKHTIKYMMKARYGKIINISSVIGLVGNFGQTNYAAAKAGIIGLSKSLAKEVASRNINVNVIAPGFIQTKMTESLSEDLKQKAVEIIPLGKFGNPEDVANSVAFLASNFANYITGQVINVDGGMVM